MAPQLRRRLVDATDVLPHGFAVRAPGHDEMAVVGLGALQVVDHQVSPARLDRRSAAGRPLRPPPPRAPRPLRRTGPYPLLLATGRAAARPRAFWRRPAPRGDGR